MGLGSNGDYGGRRSKGSIAAAGSGGTGGIGCNAKGNSYSPNSREVAHYQWMSTTTGVRVRMVGILMGTYSIMPRLAQVVNSVRTRKQIPVVSEEDETPTGTQHTPHPSPSRPTHHPHTSQPVHQALHTYHKTLLFHSILVSVSIPTPNPYPPCPRIIPKPQTPYQHPTNRPSPPLPILRLSSRHTTLPPTKQ